MTVLAAAAIATTTATAASPSAEAADLDGDAGPSLYDVSLIGDGLVIALGALGSGVPYALTGRIVDTRCPCDREEVNRLDRTAIGRDSVALARMADVTVALTLAGPLVLDGIALRDRRVWLEDAVVFTEVITTNLALVTSVKLIVQRPEPRLYDPERRDLVDRARSYLSFYSGHTSTAFAALTATSLTVGWRYDSWAVPCLASAAVGTSVGLEMVLSGRHFPTDVMVGAAAGVLVGAAIPWLHLRGRGARLVPLSIVDGAGLAVRGSL